MMGRSLPPDDLKILTQPHGDVHRGSRLAWGKLAPRCRRGRGHPGVQVGHQVRSQLRLCLLLPDGCHIVEPNPYCFAYRTTKVPLTSCTVGTMGKATPRPRSVGSGRGKPIG
jgi:hypothetical protein